MATTQETYNLDASALKASLRGELILPNDPGYEAVRNVYNGMIDKHPALIVRCADVADVIAAVNFGRENDLLVSIRGGGHNAGGLGICDDGLVIDLSLIRYVHVDPQTRIVRVGGGSTWGDVDHATHAFGLAVPCGIISTTGVGGLTLGGGLGYLTRKCGLAIDNLTADEQHHADLFWALYPPGHQWYWKADFVNELSDEAIALSIQHGSQLPTMQSTMHLYPVNGAAHRVGRNDTAWSYREAIWAEVIVGVDPDPMNKDRIVNWAREYWEDMHPHSAGGAYVNFMMEEEGQERVKASYRDNYERLAAIKSTYDPTNFFRVNQNIKPAL